MKSIFISLLILLVYNCYSQQRWENIYGKPHTHESFNKVLETYDRGYLLSSGYEEYHGNWLIKTDINGNMLWEKFLVWDNSQVMSGPPLQDSMGNIIVAGSVLINEGNWPSIVKIDSCGNKQWCRVFVDDSYDWAFFKDAIMLENGDVIALAHHESETQIDMTFLYYITSDGDMLWKKSYASRTDHPLIGTSSCEDIFQFNNEFFISGYCYYAYPDNPSHYSLRSLVVGIDSLFNEKWILPFGMNDTLTCETKSIVPLNDSVYMGVGIVYVPNLNSLLMFFDRNGEELGYNSITNSQIGPDIGGNYIFDIARINDTMFIASTCYGEGIMDPNPFGEFVIDTNGQVYNHQSHPNTLGRSHIIKTFDNKYVIGVLHYSVYDDIDILFYKINKDLEQDSVYTGNYTYDSLCTGGIVSGIIDITDCLVVVGTDDVPAPGEYYAGLSTISIVAYPNPAKSRITFSLGNTENHSDIELVCYDALGRKTHSEKIYHMQTQTTMDIAKWNAGIYVAKVISSGKEVGQCRFVISER